MVRADFFAWAAAATGRRTANAAAAPACLNRERRVGIGSNPPGGRELAGEFYLNHE